METRAHQNLSGLDSGMNMEPGVTFIAPEDVERVKSEVESAGAAVYRFSTKGAPEGNSIFDAVRHALPMDPPLVGSQSLDALSDSLWSGLHELDAESIAIFWDGSSDYKAVASQGYSVVLEILKDIASSLTDREMTVGKPKNVAVYVS